MESTVHRLSHAIPSTPAISRLFSPLTNILLATIDYCDQKMGQVTSELFRNDPNLPRVPRDIKFRVLIIGRANSGKTSILQRVCETTESPEVYRRDQQGRRERVRSRP
jgi:hypothetical protein